MKLRFYNGLYLDRYGSLQDGEVITDGGRIVFAGKKKEAAETFDREIDLRGNIVLPGFKNAHTHSPMTFLRSFADDMQLAEWLEKKVFPMEARLSEEDVYAFTRLAAAEYVSGGITAAFDMYFFTDTVARAAADSGFRMVCCGAVNNFSQSAEEVEEYYKRLNGCNPLISYRLGFHAEYTTGIGIIRSLSELSHKYKEPVYMHNSETRRETEECNERYGISPTALFEREGLFDYGGGGFHSIYLTEEDMQIYKKRGVYAITNPASNLKLASGIAPVVKMLRRGIPVAIGTDGPASNNAADMFREMYLTAVLQKYLENDAAACPADKVLEMAVAVGAEAMGLSQSRCIAEGMNADLTVIDMHKPNMRPVYPGVKNIVYSASKSNVAMTVVDGKILYENGEFYLGEDIEDIYREAQARADMIIKKQL